MLKKREGISVPKETLRRWLKRPHKYHPKKKRMRRECSSCFGDLLQIDGSFDVWFGQERTCLMNIVDDATNIAQLHFEREETIVSACRCAWSWFKQYGVPRAFYADGRNMYHLDPDKEHNFFTMMCEVLGIRVIPAHFPQAKGRVERYNGVHQRRLIPLMKLDGVRDMESANKYLERYVIAHNRTFSKPARNGNSHTPCLTGLKILTMCVSWKFSVKSTMIGRSATKAKPIKSLLCPNAHPPSKNVPLKKRFQGISPSLTETDLSLKFCLS